MSKAKATGWSLSSIIAAILSWALNHSLGYAIVHFLLGMIYLIYLAIFRWAEAAAAISSIISSV